MNKGCDKQDERVREKPGKRFTRGGEERRENKYIEEKGKITGVERVSDAPLQQQPRPLV
jgi:hypothetical protein